MPLMIPLSDKTGLRSALAGLGIGLAKGSAEKQRREREMAYREKLRQDDQARRDAEYRRGRADTLADQAGSRQFQTEMMTNRQAFETQQAAESLAQKREADQLARERDAQDAAVLADELGIGRPERRPPVVVPMGGANFAPVPLPDRPGRTFTNPRDVEAVARLRQSEQKAAASAENMQRDDLRADRGLTLKEQEIAARMQRGGGFATPEVRNQVIKDLEGKYGWSREQAEREVRLVENKIQTPSQVQPDQFGPKMQARANQTEVDRLRRKLDEMETNPAALASAANLRGVTPEQYVASLERQIADALAKQTQSPAAPSGSPAYSDKARELLGGD